MAAVTIVAVVVLLEFRDRMIEHRLWVMGRHLKQGRDVRRSAVLDNYFGVGSAASPCRRVTGLPCPVGGAVISMAIFKKITVLWKRLKNQNI